MGITVLVVNGHHSFCSYMGTMAAMKCLLVYTVVLTPWASRVVNGHHSFGGQWASQFLQLHFSGHRSIFSGHHSCYSYFCELMTATVRCKLGDSWSLSLFFFGKACFNDDDGLA